jgi:hypothetical protein
MIHLLRHGERGARPRLTDFLDALRPTAHVQIAPVMINFLDGLAAHKKFTAADETIAAAAPTTLWPAIVDERLFDLIVTCALRSPGGLTNIPTNPILTTDQLDFLAAKQIRTTETIQLLTIRSSLTQTFKSARQRAWLLAHDLAALYEHIGHEQHADYLDVLLNHIEHFRMRYLARLNINSATMHPYDDTAATETPPTGVRTAA